MLGVRRNERTRKRVVLSCRDLREIVPYTGSGKVGVIFCRE